MAQADTINDRLLNQNTLSGPAQEQLAGRKLREDRMGGADEGEGETKADEPKSLRQSVMAARRVMDIKQRAKDKIEEKVVAPVKRGTNWLLKQAWLSIGTVFGFIFIGLPYINLHVFGKAVLGEKFFCKLGDEWKPAYKDVAGAFGQMGRAIGIVEVMALLVLDLAAFLGVIALIAVLVIVIDLMTGVFGWFI